MGKRADVLASNDSVVIMMRIKNCDNAAKAIKEFESTMACPSDFNVVSVEIKE